ncbi:MAG: aquaporin, partial [Acidobacteriota bacterium]
TLAMMVTKNIKAKLGVAYMVAQLAGAALGSLLLKLALPHILEGDPGGNLGRHGIAKGMTSGEGLLFEIILTAFLVLVIFNTAVSKKGWGLNAPIAIGLAVMAIHFVAVPFTGASVNPARSFGPALVTNEWKDFWVYIAGPAIGALVAAGFWTFFKDFGDESLDPSVEAVATRA